MTDRSEEKPRKDFTVVGPEDGKVKVQGLERTMVKVIKNILCDLGLISLMIAPFIIIPAAITGLALFMFGEEEFGLWICSGAAGASMVLGPLTFRIFTKLEKRVPCSCGGIKGPECAKSAYPSGRAQYVKL